MDKNLKDSARTMLAQQWMPLDKLLSAIENSAEAICEYADTRVEDMGGEDNQEMADELFKMGEAVYAIQRCTKELHFHQAFVPVIDVECAAKDYLDATDEMIEWIDFGLAFHHCLAMKDIRSAADDIREAFVALQRLGMPKNSVAAPRLHIVR
jgi:hypothetical protein